MRSGSSPSLVQRRAGATHHASPCHGCCWPRTSAAPQSCPLPGPCPAAALQVEENVIAKTHAVAFGRGRVYTVRMQVGGGAGLVPCRAALRMLAWICPGCCGPQLGGGADGCRAALRCACCAALAASLPQPPGRCGTPACRHAHLALRVPPVPYHPYRSFILRSCTLRSWRSSGRRSRPASKAPLCPSCRWAAGVGQLPAHACAGVGAAAQLGGPCPLPR